jgi:hypothetical protein
MAAAITLAGAASSLLVVQQVPAMTGAGMALATASGFAGTRGLLQLAGRLPLAPVVLRLGSRRTLQGSYVLMGIGAFLLIGAGGTVQASAFAVVACGVVSLLAAAVLRRGPADRTTGRPRRPEGTRPPIPSTVADDLPGHRS